MEQNRSREPGVYTETKQKGRKSPILTNEQILAVQTCDICQKNLDNQYIRCIYNNNECIYCHYDCKQNIPMKQQTFVLQYYDRYGNSGRCLKRMICTCHPSNILKTENILNDYYCYICREKPGNIFVRCLHEGGLCQYAHQSCLNQVAKKKSLKEIQFYSQNSEGDWEVHVGECRVDPNVLSEEEIRALDKCTDCAGLFENTIVHYLYQNKDCFSHKECYRKHRRGRDYIRMYGRTKDYCQVCVYNKKEIPIRKVQSLKSEEKNNKPKIQKEKLESRKKELTQINLALVEREPVRLSPVLYTASSVVCATENLKETYTCHFCAQIIAANYLRIRLYQDKDLFCHEDCWSRLEAKPGNLQRIYRYSAQGKLLNKLTINKPPVASKPKTIKPRVQTAEQVIEPVLKQPEYQPSWRQVDVSDYEIKKEEKKRKQRIKKAGKYLDLSELQSEITLGEDCLQSNSELQSEITLGEDCLQSNSESFVEQSPQEDAQKKIMLSAQAKEYVPIANCLPVAYLGGYKWCSSCANLPATIINLPCQHVTSCIRCFPYVLYCSICRKPCQK